jgi:energy-coupling factor transport system permease protein
MPNASVSYQPGSSLVHDLHPVTKVLLVGCFILGAYLAPIAVLGGFLLLLFLASTIAGVNRAAIKAAIPILVPLGVSLTVIQGVLTAKTDVALLKLGPVTLWRAGVIEAVSFFGILSVFVLAGLIFILTTHPKRLMVGLIEKGVPRKIGYVFVASLQLVPELQRRANNILDAQRSRGLDTGGSIRNRIQALVALLSPLLIGALISTQTRALALDARGFAMKGKQTSIYSPTVSITDHAFRLFGVTAVIVLGVLRFI